jgi:hypothetical protein
MRPSWQESIPSARAALRSPGPLRSRPEELVSRLPGADDTLSRATVLPGVRISAVSSLLALMAACGASTPEPTSPASTSGTRQTPDAVTPAAANAAPPLPIVPLSWSRDMDKEQKVAFMGKNVVPVAGVGARTRYVTRSRLDRTAIR